MNLFHVFFLDLKVDTLKYYENLWFCIFLYFHGSHFSFFFCLSYLFFTFSVEPRKNKKSLGLDFRRLSSFYKNDEDNSCMALVRSFSSKKIIYFDISTTTSFDFFGSFLILRYKSSSIHFWNQSSFHLKHKPALKATLN